MKVCEQTIKPRARELSDEWREAHCLPAHCRWYIRGANCAAWGATLDQALMNWRANRLFAQLLEGVCD